MSENHRINPGQAHILGQNQPRQTPKGAQISREDAIAAMIEIGYLDFEAELNAQLVHYTECIPGLVAMGSPYREKILQPIADLQAVLASIVTSRRMQAAVEKLRAEANKDENDNDLSDSP